MDSSPQFDDAKVFNLAHHRQVRADMDRDARRGAINPEVFKNPKLKKKEINRRVRGKEVSDLAGQLIEEGWHKTPPPRVRPQDTRSVTRKATDWLGLTEDTREY